MSNERYASFFDEDSLSIRDLYDNKDSVDERSDTTEPEEVHRFQFMTHNQIEYIRKENAKHRIQNIIYMNDELDEILEDISGSIENFDGATDKETFNDFTQTDDTGDLMLVRIPNAIIWDQTIPITSVRLVRKIDTFLSVNDGFDVHEIKSRGTLIVDIRIYEENIKQYLSDMNNEDLSNEDSDEELIVVGSVEYQVHYDKSVHNIIEKEVITVPLVTSVDRHTIELDNYHIHAVSKRFKIAADILDFTEYEEQLTHFTSDMLGYILQHMVYWHGIQLAMLNPITKEYFRDNERVPLDRETKPNKTRSNKKKPLRYVRRIELDIDGIKPVLYRKDSKGKYVRKTLIWYVTGHWVHRNGKRFFRKGHWKGILRNNPESANVEPREREIVTDEDDV